MEKVRKMLPDEFGDRKMRSVWKCYCKIGTKNATVAYFFDKPREGLITQCVRLKDDCPNRSMSVVIDKVYEDGFVLCSLL